MILNTESVNNLLDLYRSKKVLLEGSIIKVLEKEKYSEEFLDYLKVCKEKDNLSRKKRLEVTKEVQKQNKELAAASIENERITKQLSKSLEEVSKSEQEAIRLRNEAEKLKDDAMEDLELLQQKTQFELVGTIVRIALSVIVGVGIITSVMYGLAIVSGYDTDIIGSTWSNMFGILLTNAFSIVGTIMGVKYASEKTN